MDNFNNLLSLATTLDSSQNEIMIPITNRDINIPLDLEDIVVQGDVNSRVIIFTLPRYFDNVDLSKKTLKIHFIFKDKTQGYDNLTNIIIDESLDIFTCQWKMSKEATIKNGELSFLIEASEQDSENRIIYRWQTKPAIITIETGISGVSYISYTPDKHLRNFIKANKNFKLEGISDTGTPILISNRKIMIDDLTNIVVSKDTNSQILSFTIPRFFDGVDLSKKLISIKFLNSSKKGDRSAAVNIETTEDTLTFGWLIEMSATIVPGKLNFAIEFLEIDVNDNLIYCWQTLPATINIEKGLDVDSFVDPMNPSYIQSYINQFNSILNEVKDAALPVDELINTIIPETREELATLTQTATTAAANASASEIRADTSATNASKSETNSANNAQAAYNSELKAKASETNAKNSETNAKTSETNSKTSETNASNYATSAATSATNAKNSEDAAKESETNINNFLNSFNTRFDNLENDLNATQNELEDVEIFVGYVNEDILGLEVDFQNKTFTRLMAATNKTAGTDFDSFLMYGGRKRCNVADNGVINAYYGDEGYIEDGSNGQVMVYQPKFYYKVVPIKIDKVVDGLGYHLRKARYYISATKRTGFKLHPAFIQNEVEKDYVLIGAYEGSIYDTSTSSYLLNDEQIADFTTDKMCSIANAKPMSGLIQSLTINNSRKLATNRGAGWCQEYGQIVAMDQLLMIIEFGTFNTQTALGQGVVTITDNSSYNCSSITGSTSSLGNTSGMAAATINEIGGTKTEYTSNGKVSISYRGKENPYGNIWKFIDGLNIEAKGIHNLYVADHSFQTDTALSPYKNAGITLAKENGYVSAMAYNEDFDWLFFPSEVKGDSSLPVGDYFYQNNTYNGFLVARLGGAWDSSSSAGGFYWGVRSSSGIRDRIIGGRLAYVPENTN